MCAKLYCSVGSTCPYGQSTSRQALLTLVVLETDMLWQWGGARPTPDWNLWTPDELQVLLLSEEKTLFSKKMELLLAMLSIGCVAKQLFPWDMNLLYPRNLLNLLYLMTVIPFVAVQMAHPHQTGVEHGMRQASYVVIPGNTTTAV